MIWIYGAIGAIAAITDYRTGKIYNWLTLPALALGLAYAAYQGQGALSTALFGVGTALALFLPVYAMGALGAGDVKLLMAFGTFLGPSGTLDLALVSLCIAATGAVALLVKHGRVKAFTREIWSFARSVFTRGLEIHWPKLRKDIKAPFGVAIFLGFICMVLR